MSNLKNYRLSDIDNSPFCQACKEPYCLIGGGDDYCELIRIYLKGKKIIYRQKQPKVKMVEVDRWDGNFDTFNYWVNQCRDKINKIVNYINQP